MKRQLNIIISLVLALTFAFPITAFAKDIEITDPDGEAETVYVSDEKPTELAVKRVNETTAWLSWYFNDYYYGDYGYEILSFNSSSNAFEHLAYSKKESVKLSNLKAGTTYRIKVRSYTEAYSVKYFGKASKELSFSTAPSAAKLKSVKYASKGKAKLSWKKSKNATGYMLVYSTKKKFSSQYTNRLTVSKKKTYFTLGGLGNGKYYVKIVPYREVDGIKYMGAESAVKTVNIKKGASVKEMVNYTKTDLSGRKAVKQLTNNGVDIKKYKTTYDRLKAIYNWHAKHFKDFADCVDCNNHFNVTVDALYGESRKYDDFIYLAAGNFQNRSGERPIHKWAVYFFAGKELIIDPRMQGYTGNFTGNTYFLVTKKSASGKRFLFDGWYFYYRGYDLCVENGEIVKYKK